MIFLCTTALDENEDISQDKKLEKCLKLISKGKTEAIGEIYDLTKTQVYGYILSIVKNPTEAEDILQDTYVKVCTCANQYTSQGKPMAWIFTIARNLSLMKLRKGTRNTDIPEYEWEQIKDEHSEFGSEDRIVLEAALEKITDEEREIVMLHAVGGMKHREIADMLDMPLATVLSKYNRSLKKLKSFLTEENS